MQFEQNVELVKNSHHDEFDIFNFLLFYPESIISINVEFGQKWPLYSIRHFEF